MSKTAASRRPTWTCGNAVSIFICGLPQVGVCRRRALVAFVALSLSGCTGPKVDQIKDPVKRAEYNCSYIIERYLAKPSELSPDGVLRRRVANFQSPRMQRAGDLVSFFWDHGAITRLGTLDAHGGSCSMLVTRQFVTKATVDGRDLHAGFSF